MKKLLLVGIAMYWAAIAAWVWPQNIVKKKWRIFDVIHSSRITAEQCVVSNHVDVHGDRFCDV
jgi:hypothetical protein